MLLAGQRVNLKHRRAAAHDLDGLPVRIVTPLVTGGLGPRIKECVERAGPDAPVRRQPITDSLAKYIHGRIAVRAVARLARGAGKPHGKAGCRLDTSRQCCRRADARERQGHRVRAAVARRQIRARVGLDGCQSDIGTALYKAHRGQARPGLRGSRSRSPRSPEGRDLPRDISGFHPCVPDLRQAAAGKRGEHYCETTGSS